MGNNGSIEDMHSEHLGEENHQCDNDKLATLREPLLHNCSFRIHLISYLVILKDLADPAYLVALFDSSVNKNHLKHI